MTSFPEGCLPGTCPLAYTPHRSGAERGVVAERNRRISRQAARSRVYRVVILKFPSLASSAGSFKLVMRIRAAW